VRRTGRRPRTGIIANKGNGHGQGEEIPENPPPRQCLSRAAEAPGISRVRLYAKLDEAQLPSGDTGEEGEAQA